MSETHEDFFNTWKLMYPHIWARYANDANAQILLEGMSLYRPCITAILRSFADRKHLLKRVDGGSDEADRVADAKRQADRHAAEEEATVVTAGDFEYVASLTKEQVSQAYHADLNGEFARVYRSLMKTHGFQAPAPRRAAPSIQPVALTKEEYYAIPASVTVQRYRTQPAFKAAVDHLVETGQI